MFGFALKYPFQATGIFCLLLYVTAGFFFNATPLSGEEISYLLIAVMLPLCCNDFYHKITLFIFSLILFLFFQLSETDCPLFLWGMAFALLIAFTVLEQKDLFHFLFAIIMASFLCHLAYVQATATDVRQHDLQGIFLYMTEITRGGINWRNFNPWNMYYLFHQPLHFILCSYLYQLGLFLWNSSAAARESLQYLSLFLVTATSLLAVLILYRLKFPSKLLAAGGLLFAFHPVFFLFSGYISDDAPVMFWSVATTYFLLCWHDSGLKSHLIWAAVCFGLGTLTKLSMLLMVPAIVFLFVYKLVACKTDRLLLFQDLCLFAIVAIPLSLIWVMRNHILYDMPFYNVPDTAPAGQNFKTLGLSERIFDFSQIFSPFLSVPQIVDANIWLAILKTELFGEWNFALVNSAIFIPAYILYILNIVLKVCLVAAFLYSIILLLRKRLAFSPIAAFFLIQYLTVWIYCFKYAMDYPYACSTDYRLFAQILLPEIILACWLCRVFLPIKKNSLPLIFAAAYALLTTTIYMSIL